MPAGDPPARSSRALLAALAVIGALAAIVAGGVALLMRGPSAPPPIDPAAPPAAQLERCIDCHQGANEDPGGLHPASVIGCEPCHLGDPKAVTADAAHRGMEPEPGALRTVDRTCGRCHQRETERVRSSLMATARGIVAVDRWAFGERPTPDGDETMADVLAAPHPTPAQDHLRRLCAGCHLGTTRDNRDDAIVQGASGCSACHSPARPPRPDGAVLLAHATVDSRVDDGRCLGCHSRSGRISLGYQGLFETSGHGIEACPEADRVTLHDGRTGCRAPADVHQRAGLACIDCHVHTELMGDGAVYRHEEQATEVRCESCHGSARPDADNGPGPTTWGAVSDAITLDLVRQRGETRAPDEPVRTGLRGTPLWNVRPQTDGSWSLVGKLDGRARAIRATPADADHTRPGHERLTCASCHDAWAPRCTTCHTRFDPDGTQWDFAAAKETAGRWHETNEGMSMAPPTLGVDAAGRIVPTMPGMIGTIESATAPASARSLRLHAAIVPHTTQREARSCSSCHADAIALGLGAGDLDLSGDAVRFTPAHPAPNDPALARDRWVDLFPATPGATTRVGGRSLDADEQRRVLTVGACLACHAPAGRLWSTTSFAAELDRLARGAATMCSGRVAPWMTPSGR